VAPLCVNFCSPTSFPHLTLVTCISLKSKDIEIFPSSHFSYLLSFGGRSFCSNLWSFLIELLLFLVLSFRKCLIL
jgi:hypothetical protein